MNRARIVSLLLCVLGFGAFAEQPAPPTGGPAPRGPLVDVAMKDGHTYTCMLLKMSEGRLETVTASGERQTNEVADVKSIRFLPVPGPNSPDRPDRPDRETGFRPPNGSPEREPPGVRPPAPPENAMDDPDGKDDDHGRLTAEDFIRLRHLNQKDREGKLSAAEEEELKKLRERAPMLPRLGKVRTAEEVARLEAAKGRLENYIGSIQSRLKAAGSDEDVKDATLALMFAYRQKGMSPVKTADALRSDMDLITTPRLRERGKDRLPEYTEFLKSFRPQR